jgi:hypothetical protein
MRKREVPLDFFSWHIYCNEPSNMASEAEMYRVMLDACGYTSTESILNEWSYIDNWSDRFLYSIDQIRSIKGASFVLACMCTAALSPIDMLMYYDARPSVYNCLWDMYLLKPLKGYYPFKWYGELYGKTRVESSSIDDCIYSIAGKDEDGKLTVLITYYTNEDDSPSKTVTLDAGESTWDVFTVDGEKEELVEGVKNVTLTLKPHTMVQIKER